jgi:hypothetical protein
MMAKLQQRTESSRFQRACAVLCLFLLLFSAAHTVFGHTDALQSAMTSAPGLSDHHELQSLATDTPDTCVLCVAMTTIVVLAVLALATPQRTQTRPTLRLVFTGPVTGWHPSLFSRPPPAL